MALLSPPLLRNIAEATVRTTRALRQAATEAGANGVIMVQPSLELPHLPHF